MGTMLMRRERPAENIISIDCIFGIVPISSAKIMTRIGELAAIFICHGQHLPVELLEEQGHHEIFRIIFLRQYDKNSTLSLQKVSVSSELSKHRICSISESRNAFSLDMAVDNTEAIAWSAVLESGSLANHLALWSEGSLSISSWNWLLFFTCEGASKS